MKLLPREAYVDQDWLERERAGILSFGWAFAGVEGDFAKEGDFVSVQCGLHPLVVIRMKDGSLAAYHNICRHRGTLLVEGERGNIGKAMICPYHRWTYSLDGRLRGAPNMSACFPDMDRGALSLKPACVGMFGGLVFAHPDPQADFDAWIGPIAAHGWPHDLNASDVQESAALTYALKCNWKVFVENAIDGYHLAYLHENTLGGPKPDANEWARHGDHLIWYATDEKGVRHSLPPKSRKEAKDWWATPITSAAQPGFGGVYLLFPNILITATPYTFSVSWLEPTSANTCLLKVRNWVGPGQSRDERKRIPGYDKASGVISSDLWREPPLDTGDFQTEDVWICERNQRGLESPAFEFGPLAKGAGAEDPIGWLHASIIAHMGEV